MTPKEIKMSNLRTHQILCQHFGENATTPHSPIGVFVEGEVDLAKTVSRCFAADFDMPTEIPLYEVREVNLPEWLTVEEWLLNRTGWSWLWNVYGVAKDADENVQRNLLVLRDKPLAYVLGKMIRTTLRSEFRISLLRQAMEWLSQTPGTQQYPSPLSPKQAGFLVGPRETRDYNRDSNNHYYRLRYNFVA